MKSLLIVAALAVSPAYAHGNHDHTSAHADAPRSFDKQPPNGPWAKCAVSGDVFQIADGTDFAQYNGRVYAFCCPDCKPDFLKNPERYADKK